MPIVGLTDDTAHTVHPVIGSDALTALLSTQIGATGLTDEERAVLAKHREHKAALDEANDHGYQTALDAHRWYYPERKMPTPAEYMVAVRKIAEIDGYWSRVVSDARAAGKSSAAIDRMIDAWIDKTRQYEYVTMA